MRCRHLLSVFSSVYKFAKLPRDIPTRLWHWCGKEFGLVGARLPFCFVGMRRPLARTDYATDSRHIVYEVCQSHWLNARVHDVAETLQALAVEQALLQAG